MIDANAQIFAKLEDYCASRNNPIVSAGKPRYIRTNDEERRLLKGLRSGKCLRFGSHRSLVHLFLDNEHYIGMVGFEFEPKLATMDLVDNNAGFTTCVLLETEAAPTVSPSHVRNIVEAGAMGDEGYAGHDCARIESLFPRIQVVQSNGPLDNDSVWRLFLMICAGECMWSGSWIVNDLAENLVALTDLNIPSMPYAAICRSMFDADPRSLFMALYRCIEATYSHQSSKQLVERLGLNIPWHKMAEALEDEIGWHPQEAASLNIVLKDANEEDLEAICRCLRFGVGKDAQISAGRAIYSLRNSIVHFRPGTKEIRVDEIDWNELCRLLINIVFDVFTKAYS